MADSLSEFLCLLSPTRASFPSDATEAELQAVAAHFEHLQAMLARGRLILAGRTQEDASPIGLVIFRAADATAAKREMADDPAVRAGVFLASIRPYRVALSEA
mgnify:CR=1 FL=1